MKIKVLPLDYWMKFDPTSNFHGKMLKKTLQSCVQVPATFNRPGIYMVARRAWFELPDGRAFLYRTVDFEYVLSIHEAEKYNEKQVQALSQIIAQGLATKAQKALFRTCQEVRELRKIRPSARLSRLKFNKRRES